MTALSVFVTGLPVVRTSTNSTVAISPGILGDAADSSIHFINIGDMEVNSNGFDEADTVLIDNLIIELANLYNESDSEDKDYSSEVEKVLEKHLANTNLFEFTGF